MVEAQVADRSAIPADHAPPAVLLNEQSLHLSHAPGDRLSNASLATVALGDAGALAVQVMEHEAVDRALEQLRFWGSGPTWHERTFASSSDG
jgi:hypothetical protein